MNDPLRHRATEVRLILEYNWSPNYNLVIIVEYWCKFEARNFAKCMRHPLNLFSVLLKIEVPLPFIPFWRHQAHHFFGHYVFSIDKYFPGNKCTRWFDYPRINLHRRVSISKVHFFYNIAGLQIFICFGEVFNIAENPQNLFRCDSHVCSF